MFFKRLSRSRSNSQSYVDDYANNNNNSSNNKHDSKANSSDYEYVQRPQSSSGPQSTSAQPNNTKDSNMYSTQSAQQSDYNTPPLSSSGNRAPTNGYAARSSMGQDPSSAKWQAEAAPDLLTRAFNEALRPYTSRMEDLESEIADLRQYVEELEGHRKEVHAWIDKRGLRPGKQRLALVHQYFH